MTLVELFDPACETCRAFDPIVKNLLAQYSNEVRLVIRYAPWHQGSDQVVRLLEKSKHQDLYVYVLEYKAAQQAGLDLPRALVEAAKPEVDTVRQQDVQDLKALRVDKTLTFFVNGRSLPGFGAEHLAELVAQEVAKAKK